MTYLFPFSIWTFISLFFPFLFGLIFPFFIIFSISVQFQFNFSSISVQFQSFFLYSYLSNRGLILDFFQILDAMAEIREKFQWLLFD
jgi:hypothetical protein